MAGLGLESWSFDSLSKARAATLQMWVIEKGLDSSVANDLPGFHFNDVACGLIFEINKQCGQSVSSPEDPHSQGLTASDVRLD